MKYVESINELLSQELNKFNYVLVICTYDLYMLKQSKVSIIKLSFSLRRPDDNRTIVF
ncbi:hypothetical protein SASK001_16400 [Staphylococcus argenteus]|nr:hypothetical protein SA19082_16020 [Staphylococcus argenteus]GJF52595.1 hypothetical protein SA19086_19020 [Staphylococcus argenteus]GJF57637.1 hypothetical protein SA19103_17770 [Staphylococcus argenteus]GJF65783.1 hypothetical protein SA19133_21240 [Staphylococcus argenteus]GJF75565.1 hypothetical protein SA19220_16710 [Staphylococcus argenteus]